MSGYTNQSPFTVAAPPTTAEVALQILSSMQAQSGILTDYNPGSIIRTFSEATGSVVEIEAVSAQALAFQAMVYGTWSAFGINPYPESYASTTLTFATSFGSNPPLATTNIYIGINTYTSTQGNIQFQTTASATLLSGTSSISVPIQAVTAGPTSNVSANTITVLNTSLTYPLVVTNPSAATGGSFAETPGQTMSRFMSKVASLGLASPVAIANAVIGVTVSGTGEKVVQSSLVEPWITASGNGASFNLYVDDGTGGAQPALLTAVTNLLNGNISTGDLGFRPAGVPFTVNAVSPVTCTVVVSGTVSNTSFITTLQTNVVNALVSYFQNIQFGQSVAYVDIVAVVANTVSTLVTSLQITLLNSNGVSVTTQITATSDQRIILSPSPSVVFA